MWLLDVLAVLVGFDTKDRQTFCGPVVLGTILAPFKRRPADPVLDERSQNWKHVPIVTRFTSAACAASRRDTVTPGECQAQVAP